MTNSNPTPLRLEVSRDGRFFIGDLVFSNGDVWRGWQVFKSYGALKRNARASISCPIVRVDGESATFFNRPEFAS